MSNNVPVDSFAQANKIPLPGLIGSNPLGALTAFGLLKVLSEEFPGTKLAFEMRDDWVAVLHNAPFDSSDALIAWLSEWVKSPILSSAFSWCNDPRMSQSEHSEAVAKSLRSDDLFVTNLLGCFATEHMYRKGPQKKQVSEDEEGSEKNAPTTAFYMCKGGTFFKAMRQHLAVVRNDATTELRDALMGWSYRSDVSGLGLDQTSERIRAYRWRAPAGDRQPSVSGAMIFAMFGISLFAVLSTSGRVNTLGFCKRDKEQYFRWPIFDCPVSIWTLKTLLANCGNAESKLRTGVATEFETHRYVSNPTFGLANFRSAKPRAFVREKS